MVQDRAKTRREAFVSVKAVAIELVDRPSFRSQRICRDDRGHRHDAGKKEATCGWSANGSKVALRSIRHLWASGTSCPSSGLALEQTPKTPNQTESRA